MTKLLRKFVFVMIICSGLYMTSIRLSEWKLHLLDDVRIHREIPQDPSLLKIDDMVSGEDEKCRLSVSGECRRMNVLLIIVDDLRPQLGIYKVKDTVTSPERRATSLEHEMTSAGDMVTPHLDRLGSESIVFTRAYTQYSLCGPSRTSMLTSRRPDTTRIFGNKLYWRATGGNFTTLPQHFKNSGYHTVGTGKVFHPQESSRGQDPTSWSEPFVSHYRDDEYDDAEFPTNTWVSVTERERRQVPLTDDLILEHALRRLRHHAADARSCKQPLFMAVGFTKPHMSLICPKKYFDLYPLEAPQFLANATWETLQMKNPMRGTRAVSDVIHELPELELRRLRRAYSACVSYMDDNVGKLLDELEKVGLKQNTVVAFTADHGFHLGENQHWGKLINHERATHVPLMIRIPGATDAGVRTDAVVESVDLFPTLVEAAGLEPVAPCPTGSADVRVCTQGTSLLPLVKCPGKSVKRSALSQVVQMGHVMKYSLRTPRFRYSSDAQIVHEAQADGKYTVTADWTAPDPETLRKPWMRALYDHVLDPEEMHNVVNDPEYRDVVRGLQEQLAEKVGRTSDVPVQVNAFKVQR